MLWRIISFAVTPQRKLIESLQTLDEAIDLIKKSKNIVVLTGAGISVACGIPDFRSKNGIYSRLSKEYTNLSDPQLMFDIKYFYHDPRPFFKFAREIFPGQFKPSLVHKFIKHLENRGVLLRNYTQNIDTLERVAEISSIIECHGSFENSKCTKCEYVIKSDLIRDYIFNQQIPICSRCNPNGPAYVSIEELTNAVNAAAAKKAIEMESNANSTQQTVDENETNESLRNEDDSEKSSILTDLVKNGIFKPNIVFFGEELNDHFHETIENDRYKCDLLIVIGSSLKVRPVAMIPQIIPSHVPQILINREALSHQFDINLYGNADVIISHINASIDGKSDENQLLDDVPFAEIKSKLDEFSHQQQSVEHNPENLNFVENVTTTNINISNLLPPNSFTNVSPRNYVFSGAEITLDKLDKNINTRRMELFNDDDDDDDDDDEDDEDEDDEEVENDSEERVEKVDGDVVQEKRTIEVQDNDEANSVLPVKKQKLDNENIESIESIECMKV
jgi:NAD-dependent deacetylase sirtuin 1